MSRSKGTDVPPFICIRCCRCQLGTVSHWLNTHDENSVLWITSWKHLAIPVWQTPQKRGTWLWATVLLNQNTQETKTLLRMLAEGEAVTLIKCDGRVGSSWTPSCRNCTFPAMQNSRSYLKIVLQRGDAKLRQREVKLETCFYPVKVSGAFCFSSTHTHTHTVVYVCGLCVDMTEANGTP